MHVITYIWGKLIVFGKKCNNIIGLKVAGKRKLFLLQCFAAHSAWDFFAKTCNFVCGNDSF